MEVVTIVRALKRLPRLLATRLVDLRLATQTRQGGRVRIGQDVSGAENARFAGHNGVGRGALLVGEIRVGHGSTIGPYNVLRGPLEVGNYCQFAPHVGIYARDHPTSYLTTYTNRSLFGGRLKELYEDRPITIGHDVWLGYGVIVLKGVRIGTGAVIGAGAVVTRDVPEYAIAVGNPARVLRPRLPEAVIDLLRQLAWWELTPEELGPYEDLFQVDYHAETERGLELLRAALRRRQGEE